MQVVRLRARDIARTLLLRGEARCVGRAGQCRARLCFSRAVNVGRRGVYAEREGSRDEVLGGCTGEIASASRFAD